MTDYSQSITIETLEMYDHEIMIELPSGPNTLKSIVIKPLNVVGL